MTRRVVDERMRAYYDRRAGGVRRLVDGDGRFADRDRPGWPAEVEALVAAVRALPPLARPRRRVRDRHTSRDLRGEVTALDQSAGMAAIAAGRACRTRGSSWRRRCRCRSTTAGSTACYTSHFYGHLLEGERKAFVDEARRVARELVVVDTARRAGVATEEWQERVLDDGSRHRVYKRFFDACELAEELGGGRVLLEGSWFVAVAA